MTAHYALLKQTLISHLNSGDSLEDLHSYQLVRSFLSSDFLNKSSIQAFSKHLEAQEYIKNLFYGKGLNSSEIEALRIFSDLLGGLDLKILHLKFTYKQEIKDTLENLIHLEQILANKFSDYRPFFNQEKLRYLLPLKEIM